MSPAEQAWAITRIAEGLPYEEAEHSRAALGKAAAALAIAADSSPELAEAVAFAEMARVPGETVSSRLADTHTYLDAYVHDITGREGAAGTTAAAAAAAELPPGPPTFPANPELAHHEQEAAEKRNMVLDRIGHLHDPTGIDTERVGHFFDALGLVRPDAELVVDARYLREVRAALRAAGVLMQKGAAGEYYDRLGLAVTLRYEGEDAAALAVRTHVHENAHAARIHGTKQLPRWVLLLSGLRNASPTLPLRGFGGDFAEEGWAEWVRAAYRQHVTPEGRDAVRGKLLLPDGQLPEKYSDYGWGMYYAYGSLYWDILFAKDPGLIDLVAASRQDMDSVGPELRRRINAIHDGLFEHLTNVPHDMSTPALLRLAIFKGALQALMEATGVKGEDLPDLCDNGPGAAYIRQRLADHERKTGFRFA